MDWLTAALFGYFVGSIPFGLLLSLAAGKGDIRQIGSGNIGATNVLRTGSKWLAAATLLLDLGKGVVAVLVAAKWWSEAANVAALGAIVGHCFPVWLRFRGGKGVATTAGVCFGLAWPVGVTYAVMWLAVLALTRVSSLAGVMAALIAPVAAAFLGRTEHVAVLAVIGLIVVIKHRENLARLRAGTEPKVGAKK